MLLQTKTPEVVIVGWESVIQLFLAHPGLVTGVILSFCALGAIVVVRVTRPGTRLRLRSKDFETVYEYLPPLDFREEPPGEEDRKAS